MIMIRFVETRGCQDWTEAGTLLWARDSGSLSLQRKQSLQYMVDIQTTILPKLSQFFLFILLFIPAQIRCDLNQQRNYSFSYKFGYS